MTNTNTAAVTLIVGHICKTAELRTNKSTGDHFYSVRVAENDRNGEAHFYSFTVKSEKLAKYLVKGKYVAVAGVVKSREKDGYVNYDISGAQVKLLNQVKREEVKTEATEPEKEYIPADEYMPF